MNLRSVLALAFVALGSFVSAEPLSRAQAVAAALEANTDVKKSLETQRALDGRKMEALADALPELKLAGSALRYRDPSFLNSGSFDDLPPEFKDALTVVPTPLYETQARLHQTLWSFSLGAAIRGAKIAVSLGKEDVRRVRQLVALEAVYSYNAYLASLAVVKVGQNAVQQKEKQLQNARDRRAAGVATDLEVLRFAVDLENTRTELLRRQGSTDLARGRLNAVMMKPIDAEVTPTDALAYVPLEVSLEEVIREAWASRPEAKGAQLNERIYGEAIKVARADALPRLDLDGAYGWSARDAANLFNSDFSKWNVAVTLTVPIFDGRRTAGRVAQVTAERNKASQDVLALENRIRLEAKEAVDRLRVSRSVLEAAVLNVEHAQKALDMTQANYKAGAATPLDVLDAQAAFTQADYNRVEALHAHSNARASIRFVMAQDPLDPPTPATEATPAAVTQLPMEGALR